MQLKPLARTILLALSAVMLVLRASAAELVIPGSGNPEYVLGVLAHEFNARQKAHRVSVPPSVGTAGAIRDVLAGTAVLARVGRPLADEERAKGLVYVPIGRDPVVFVAGSGVTVRAVTTNQLLDAYRGKIADWRELGGKPGPVRAIGREKGDASRQALASKIPELREIAFGAGVKVVHLDPQMIDLLDRYETSLGFMNRSALLAAKTKVAPLTLDGVEPTAENVASGRYPIWLEFGLIHKAGAALDGEAAAFMAFLKSPEAARILRANGIVIPGASG